MRSSHEHEDLASGLTVTGTKKLFEVILGVEREEYIVCFLYGVVLVFSVPLPNGPEFNSQCQLL